MRSRSTKCAHADEHAHDTLRAADAGQARAPIFTEWEVPGAIERATKLNRHRVEGTWAGHIKCAA